MSALFADEQEMETHDIVAMMHWSQWQDRETRDGPRKHRYAPISFDVKGKFWASWGKNKSKWTAAGFSVSKAIDWTLNQWLTPEGHVSEGAKQKARELELAEKETFLTPDYLPQDVTLTTPQSALLYPYQREPAIRLKAALMGLLPAEGTTTPKQLLAGLNGNALDASDTGCHAKGTPILMYDGTIKAVESVEVGDLLMGCDSTPREVLRLARGREQMARIVPVKGDPFVVNTSHILSLIQTNTHASRSTFATNGQVLDVRVSEWLAWQQGRKHIHKLFRVGVDCWPEKQFALDPYSLGVLLGDGCMTTKGGLSITKPGQEMLVEAQRIAARFGCRLTTRGDMFNPTHHFAQNLTLWAELQTLGIAGLDSGAKFVPHDYKTASRDQRREVLAGLLDTDGHMANGGFDFISKSETLSLDVAFLARSLGLAAYVKQCEKGCQTGAVGTYYRVSVSGDCSIIPCRLLRKQAPARTQIKDVLRTGFTVELLPEDDFYGFSLTGDGRFCLGDFTVTHNTGKTIVALVVCAELGLKPCVIAPLAVLTSWQRAAKFLDVPLGWCINYEKIRGGKSGLARWKTGTEMGGSHRPNEKFFEFTYLPKNSIIVYDETQRAKSPDTLQGQMLRDSAQAGHKILMLSATAAKDPTEMRNLGAALGLHDGTLHGFQEFQKYYGCYQSSYGYRFDWKAKKRLEELHRCIFPLRGQRIRVSEVPDFPETTITADALDTGNTETIKTAYEEMDRKLAEAATKSAGEKGSMTLAAIMAARVASEKGKLDLFESLAKEAIEEGRSPIIFLNFRAHIAELAARFKTTSIIWGTDMNGRAQKPDERQQIIDDFQHDKTRIVFVSLQAGGAGISLHDQFNGEFPRLALISPSFSAIDLKQALGRAHRAGAKTKSFQRIIFAAGTIEEEICQSMRNKLGSLETINDGALQPAGLAEKLKGVKLEGEATLV